MDMFSTAYGICTAGAACGLFVFSVVPPLQTEHLGVINTGPWIHMFAYGMLCVFTSMWLAVGRTVRRPVASAAFSCIVFGMITECVQAALPYRNFEMTDILINCCAVLGVAVPLHIYMRRAAHRAAGPAGRDGARCQPHRERS